MSIDATKTTFNFMFSNFDMASKEMPSNFKSLNWDAFPNGFSDLIKKEEIWPNMLRNALTIGFNDALQSFSNKRFKPGNSDLWKEMKQGDFSALIKEENDKNLFKSIPEKVKALINSTDIEYVASNCIGEVGNPVVYEMNIKVNYSKSYKVRYNVHDHDDIYHSWFIVNQLNYLEQEHPIICEIGSGYGGLATKIKNNFKKSKIIIFDLPEINAVQSYFLINTFPQLKVFGYNDFLKYGSEILDQDFDFLIMPGWTAGDLLKKRQVDAFINVRSMMEMSRAVIKDYFGVVQSNLRENGLFACINRYTKSVVTHSNNSEINRIAEYPFDEYWTPLYSFPSEIQPHIHLLIAKRERVKPKYPFKELLKTVRPNFYQKV